MNGHIDDMKSIKTASSSIAPVRTKRAFEEVSAELKKAIISGHYKPGDRLPSENELSRQFDVSRQTVGSKRRHRRLDPSRRQGARGVA